MLFRKSTRLNKGNKMDRKDYLKSRISEALKGPIEESYKKKYETAPEGVKAVADHMAMLKKQPTDLVKRNWKPMILIFRPNKSKVWRKAIGNML
jgi:hypothetical protein